MIASRVRYDQHCFSIDDRDTLIFSAAFHYFRTPSPLWADRFEKLKAAGFNTVETYVPWNWHERVPPKNLDDHSKLEGLDQLRNWLKMATQQFGLLVMLRPGPYICAEWDGGGLPQWLVAKKPAGMTDMWFRGDGAEMLGWCRHWIRAVAEVAAPFQITRLPVGTPGIFCWQIENEYEHDPVHSPEQKYHHLLSLFQATREAGIDVPLFTCDSKNPLVRTDPLLRNGLLETTNVYPRYDVDVLTNLLDRLGEYQPEKMRAVSELQGGWFAGVGGKLSWEQNFTAAHLRHITLRAWAHGFTSTNYYMGVGGTNFGDWAARTVTTTYDYDAIIHEDGGTSDRYAAAASMGAFLAEHGRCLVRTEDELVESDGLPPSVTLRVRRTQSGARYCFLFNNAESEPVSIDATASTVGPGACHWKITTTLSPFDAGILYLKPGEAIGQWLPTPPATPPTTRSTTPPLPLTDIRCKIEPGPGRWKPMPASGGVEAIGIFDRRFIYYRTAVPASALAEPRALVITPGAFDSFIVLFNGHRLTPEPSQWSATVVLLPLWKEAAPATLTLIYENPGRTNVGDALDAPSGLRSLNIVDPKNLPLLLGGWTRSILSDADRDPHSPPPVDDHRNAEPFDINGGAVDLVKPGFAFYRCTVYLTADELAVGRTLMHVGRIADRGSVWANGQRVAQSLDFRKAVQVDARPALVAGPNTFAVVVENTKVMGGLGHGAWLGFTDTPVPPPTTPLHWEMSGDIRGVVEQWWAPQMDDSDWTPLSANSTPEDSFLMWYRIVFRTADIQDAEPPWHLRLDAVGNGLLYLNGKPLGRWWEVGPQRDFFLPACWLNPPSGRPNVITLCLRPTTEAKLRTATLLFGPDLRRGSTASNFNS